MGKYYVTDIAANIVPAESGGGHKHVESLTADITLTVEDSGKLFLLDAVGEVITLPTSLVNGCNFKFRMTATASSTDWTIVAATNVIQGYAAVDYATILGSNENTISLVASTAIAGDWVEVVCDGTSWHANGVGSATGAITFSAP